MRLGSWSRGASRTKMKVLVLDHQVLVLVLNIWSYYCRGIKWEHGAKPTPLPPHFNHSLYDMSFVLNCSMEWTIYCLYVCWCLCKVPDWRKLLSHSELGYGLSSVCVLICLRIIPHWIISFRVLFSDRVITFILYSAVHWRIQGEGQSAPPPTADPGGQSGRASIDVATGHSFQHPARRPRHFILFNYSYFSAALCHDDLSNRAFFSLNIRGTGAPRRNLSNGLLPDIASIVDSFASCEGAKRRLVLNWCTGY